MSRSIRLALVGLLSALLTLGMAELTTISATAAPAAAAAAATPTGRADSAACTYARAQDAAAAADVSREQAKFNKTKKAVKKAKKAVKKANTVKHKKVLKKAKKKNKRAKARLVAAQNNRRPASSAVVVFCGTNPTGTPAGTPLPSSTPGVSPLQPLCAQVPQLQPLCDATAAAGNTSPLQPLCSAVPQLAVLCTVTPGQLADPAQITSLLNQIGAALPQGVALVPFAINLLNRLLTGDAAGVAQTLGTSPQVLAATIRALLGQVPGFPAIPGLPV